MKQMEALGHLIIQTVNALEGNDLDSTFYAPCSWTGEFELRNLICVTGLNWNNQWFAASDYGVQAVDLAAPMYHYTLPLAAQANRKAS